MDSFQGETGMKKIAPVLLLMIFLLTACAVAPERKDPFAGLNVSTAASPYRDLTLALIISENTKNAVDYGVSATRMMAWPLDSPGAVEKMIGDFAVVFQRNFKSVAKVDRMEDAAALKTDLVAVFDVYVTVPKNVFSDAKYSAQAIFMRSDGTRLDTVGGESTVNTSSTPFGLGATRVMAALSAAADNARQALERGMLASAKLVEFSKAHGPAAAAVASAIGTPKALKSAASDIDRPSFKPSETAFGDDDMAVIIGVERYQDLPSSDYSSGDASLVKEYLFALGMKERNMELLLNERATQSSIKKTIETWLPNRVKKNSRVVIYYSGHGAPDVATGEGYMVPFDGDPNYLADTGYPLKRLYDRAARLDVAEVSVILDSCFSGAGGRSVLAKGARPLVMMAEKVTLPANMAVLTSTQGTQISTSAPDKGHGVFTYYFLKAIKNGRKNLSEIYGYIKPLVEDEAKTLNVKQSPSIMPEPELISGRFSLRR